MAVYLVKREELVRRVYVVSAESEEAAIQAVEDLDDIAVYEDDIEEILAVQSSVAQLC